MSANIYLKYDRLSSFWTIAASTSCKKMSLISELSDCAKHYTMIAIISSRKPLIGSLSTSKIVKSKSGTTGLGASTKET
jgi:hypothetical protein